MAQTLTFSVQGRSESPSLLVATARGTTITVDENTGFNPVEYLLAAYAGCLNLVIHKVAKRRGVALQGLELTVSGPVDLTRFVGEPLDGAARAGLQDIVVAVKTASAHPAGELESIVAEAKQRCPVSDNLSHATPVEYHVAATATASA